MPLTALLSYNNKKEIPGTVCYKRTLLSKGNFCKPICKPTVIPSHCPQSLHIPVMFLVLTQANTNWVSLNLFWGIDNV